MQIIALTGQAQAGKTHIVQELAKTAFEAGQRPVFVSFAGALKRASAEAGYPKDTHPKQYREFCQTYGAEKRDEDPNYWVNLTLEEIQQYAELEQQYIAEGRTNWEIVILIDDVRYENEVDAIAAMEGIFIHVHAGKRLPTPYAKFRRHESEKLGKRIDRTGGDVSKLSKIFHDRGDVECSVFWLDNSMTQRKLNNLLAQFGEFFLGIKVPVVISTDDDIEDAIEAAEDVARSSGAFSEDEIADFLKDLNKLFDEMDEDDDNDDDIEWETTDDDFDPDEA